MVTISIIGVEPPLGRQISREMTSSLAELYELTSDDFFYVLPECFYVHNGVEQNMWNILVKVNAPEKYHQIEGDAVKVLKAYLQPFCINMAIEFYYYHDEHRYEFIDDTHPRYITEENSVFAEYDDYEMDECEDGCEHHHHDEDGEDIYLGNAFEEFGHMKNED